MAKHWTQSVADAFSDIRHKVVEEGFWGRAVTPRNQNITIGSPEERSSGEPGWIDRFFGREGCDTTHADRVVQDRDRDHGIER